jgi:hypothetical protein
MFESMDMNYNDHRLLATSTVASGSGIVQPKFTIPPVSKHYSYRLFNFFLGNEIDVANAEIHFKD